MSNCCRDGYQTPWGFLRGRDLEDAHNLYLYFYDMVNDGAKKDYGDARTLYAHPAGWLARMKDEEREIDKLGKKYKMHGKDEEMDVASEEPANSEAIAQLDQEALEHERKEMLEQERAGLRQEKDSNFSASFYGPVFDSEPSVDIVEQVEHRYYYVHETHKPTNRTDLFSRMIRYFLLTFPDPRGRVCLHNACRFGDKHFVTMIVMEADYLGHGIVDEIIDRKDEDRLTPFYLLCEEGFRKKYDFDEEEQALLEGFEKTIAVEVTIDKNNDGLEEDPDQQKHLEEYLKKKKQQERMAPEITEAEWLLREGLQYTTHQPMRQCIDLECTKPSRCLLTKFLLIRGANPNI